MRKQGRETGNDSGSKVRFVLKSRESALKADAAQCLAVAHVGRLDGRGHDEVADARFADGRAAIDC